MKGKKTNNREVVGVLIIALGFFIMLGSAAGMDTSPTMAPGLIGALIGFNFVVIGAVVGGERLFD